MFDSNLTDKISETIINTFKQIDVFKKIKKMQFNVNSFLIISCIIGLTNIYINYCNIDKINNLEKKIKDCENILKYNIEINREQNQIIYNNLINELKNEVELTSKLFNQIKELKLYKPEMISASTSISSFSPIKIILPPENNDCDNNIIMHKEIEDNELLNESYDSIPMNNLKKNNSLIWLFR
jgi:hypothetical protein